MFGASTGRRLCAILMLQPRRSGPALFAPLRRLRRGSRPWQLQVWLLTNAPADPCQCELKHLMRTHSCPAEVRRTGLGMRFTRSGGTFPVLGALPPAATGQLGKTAEVVEFEVLPRPRPQSFWKLTLYGSRWGAAGRLAGLLAAKAGLALIPFAGR